MLLGFWAKSEAQPLANLLLTKKRLMNVPGSGVFHSIDLIVLLIRLEYITLLYEEFLVTVI